MSEAYFYHLTTSSVQAALPLLLEKLNQKERIGLVQFATQETCDKFDTHLWHYKETAFLPHMVSDTPCECPLLLTLSPQNLNQASICFLCEGVALPQTPYQRLCILFDGQDPDELATARAQWKEAKDKGLACVYFQQDESGRWVKKG